MIKEIQESCAKQFEEELERSFYKTLGVSAKTLHNKIEQLEQENQLLKKANKILNENALHNAKVVEDTNWKIKRYKSVLDEIREYIENDQSFIYGVREPNGEFVWKDTANKEDMIAILDKVGE